MLKPDLSNPIPGGSGRSPRPLPALPGMGANQLLQPTAPQVSTRAKSVVSGNAPPDACLYSLAFGEAPCIGLVGDRGTGKSTAMRAICRAYLQRSVGVVLACDKGGGSGFEGQRRVDVDDLAAHPMDPEPRAVVFVGDPHAAVDPDPEQVAALAWRLSARRVPSLVVVDELKWSARGGWWRKGVIWLPQTCSEGRKHGVGILWASQSPQDAPREAFEESGILVCYRLAGRGLDRLDERGYLQGIDPQQIAQLPGDFSPPAERGRCVLLRRGQPWDRRFYRFSV